MKNKTYRNSAISIKFDYYLEAFNKRGLNPEIYQTVKPDRIVMVYCCKKPYKDNKPEDIATAFLTEEDYAQFNLLDLVSIQQMEDQAFKANDNPFFDCIDKDLWTEIYRKVLQEA